MNEHADKTNLLTKAKHLLDHALLKTKNEQILAETNFHMARCYHSEGHTPDAHRVSHYSEFSFLIFNV
jgi:hypothetical protein